MKRGDHVQIQRKDGYSTIGEFKNIDDDFITVVGSVGNDMGHDVLVPRDNISMIVITSRRRKDEDIPYPFA